jgi:ATP-binding cassette subfamily B multidrug efflux pump
LRPYSGKLALVLGLVVLGAVAQAGGPWLIGRAIDRYILRGDAAGLSRTMLLLFGIYVLGAIASRGQVYQVGSIGQGLIASMRARIFDRLQHLPLRYFDRQPVGDLMSRVTNDVDTLNQLFSQGLTQLLGSLFSLIGIVVAMLFLDWNLALACFTIIPIMLFTTSFFARRARRAFRLTRETVGDVTAGVQEDIMGVREAQAFNRTEENIARFRQRNAANRDANVQAVAITSAFSPAIDVLSTLATALVIGYGGYLVFEGSLSVGLLAAFLIYVQQFFRPIQLVSQVYTQAQAAVAGAERIYNILDEKPEPEDPPDAPKLGTARGRITFDRVTFAYDPGRPVLHDVDFDIEPGKTVALVGPTGAGKTTIASLIPRFYDATEGTVLIDGRDVKELARKDLRANIGIVLQEPFLFSGTIAENIGYGRSGNPSEATRILGEGGGALSQGQRQLLSFARAVLTDPRILILDEATSNIDTRTEAIIQKALATLLEGRTSVVIAHRLSTIRNADLILVIENGRVAERGTHAELFDNNGLYADLYRRQFREPVSSGGGS